MQDAFFCDMQEWWVVELSRKWVKRAFGTDGESASSVAGEVFLYPVKLLQVGGL